MSTVGTVIALVDEVKPNAFSSAVKAVWLTSLDRKIAVNVLLLSREDAAQIKYSDTDPDAQLLVDVPYDDLYGVWLQAQIDFQNGEYEKYQNTMEMFNALYGEFVRWYAMTYDPAQGCLKEAPRCYLTAYGLAVKAGYQGTEEEWIESLHGRGLELKNENNLVQWRYDNEDVWHDLLDVQEIMDIRDEVAEDRDAIEAMTVTAEALPEGAVPTVEKTVVGGVVNLRLGIPAGKTGPKGPAYELTNEDKTAITEAVLAELPVYGGETA